MTVVAVVAVVIVATVGGFVAAVAGAPVAGAQTTSDPVAEADAQVARLRQQADALAGPYFEALGALADVQQKVDDIEQRLPVLTAQADRLRGLTRERAIAAYKRSGQALGSVLGAGDAMDAARRARWLDRLNQRDDAVQSQLRAATARLADERVQLHSARDAAAAALDQVRRQGAQIDALLASAQDRRQAAIVAATTAATAATAGTDPAAAPSAAPSSTVTTNPAAAASPTTTTTTQPPKSTPPPPPPSYSPTPGVSPHHDDPFLVCTRTRESSGNYAAYNPAGPYMGAYQFLQSTWNSAANHAGRPELIGVPPNAASQFDQDEVAWSLYQWQGTRSWGVACG